MSALFTPTEARFLQRLASGTVVELATSQTAASLYSNYYLGRATGKRFLYEPDDVIRAAELLKSAGISLEPLPAGSLRSDATEQGGGSEKSRTQRPHADSIPVKPMAGCCRVDSKPLVLAPGGYMVVNAAVAQRITATRLMLVDNVETFRRLEQYRWIDYGDHDVLAMYRGDAWFNQAETLAVVAARTEPVWCFYDFDPEGLGRAATQPRLEKVVLPDVVTLTAAVRHHERRDLFSNNDKTWRPTLDGDTRPLIAEPWALMKSLRRGLPQEWMERLD